MGDAGAVGDVSRSDSPMGLARVNAYYTVSMLIGQLALRFGRLLTNGYGELYKCRCTYCKELFSLAFIEQMCSILDSGLSELMTR